MARFSIGEDDEDVPIVNKRPRFSEPASQSQPPRSVHQSRSQAPVVAEEEEEEDLIPVDDVDSDSQGLEEEDEEDDEEFEAEEEEEEGDDTGSDEDDDEEAAVMEGDAEALGAAAAAAAAAAQYRQQQVTASRAASSQLGQGNLAAAGGGLRRCSTVAPVFNNASGALQVVLTDPDVLDCPICLEPLSSPIFQCENGHIACSLCCSKVKRKCPSCCMPIGYNRCRAIEKVIESVRVACKYTRLGCKETMTYSKKIEHEQLCPYVTCLCPHPSCTFASSSKTLYLHFGMQHAACSTRFTYDTPFLLRVEINQKHMLLQEQHESVIFVLNHGTQGHGRVFNLDCIGPSMLKTAFVYQLTAKSMDTSLSLQSKPEVYAKWSEHTPTKNYLTVPSEFSGYNGLLSLHVCIKKAPAPDPPAV